MVAIKSIIVATSLLFQIAQSYCIHNQLSDSAISVIQELAPVVPKKNDTIFNKTMEPGVSKCCHYNLKRCTHSGDPNETVILYFKFSGWRRHVGQKFMLPCVADGDLTLVGNEAKHLVVCRDGKGVENVVPIVILPDRK